ncbi:protein rep [Agrococcus terreus]|uniref:Replication protein n=1 Tax=Agrococcus terreus TaxID=574649 RepID=A0ABQ2KFZ4_9MICO|nr:protein rep [Agrococcus terreus]GGN82366.1 hypothetical protein GCM10010968_12110 [Agrococcus terreus]
MPSLNDAAAPSEQSSGATSHVHYLATYSNGDTPQSEEAQYLIDYSSSSRLKSCSPNSHCKHRWCPTCSCAESRRLIGATLPKLEKFAAAVMVTLTIPDSPELAVGMKKFLDVKARLRTRLRSWGVPAMVSSVELTAPAGSWHPHLHLVLFGAEEVNLRSRAEEIARAWVEIAQDLGLDARLQGQHIDSGTPEKLASYAYKPKLGSGANSIGRLIREAARGDADAAERWAELEEFIAMTPGLRWRSSAGLNKPQEAVSASQARHQKVPVYQGGELALFALLNFLGVRTKAEQAKYYSPAKVGRLRANFPDAILDQVREQLEHPELKPEHFGN